MTKYLSTLLIFLILLAISTTASAEFVGPGSTKSLVTAKSVSEMNDDDNVILEGYILKKISSEHFIFKDSTGEIEIEIDNEDFRGVKVTPETKVRISGEIDKDSGSATVDVDTVELVK